MRLIRKLQTDLFIFTVISVLFFGALSPIFRDDEPSKYIGGFAVTILTALALFGVFNERMKGKIKAEPPKAC